MSFDPKTTMLLVSALLVGVGTPLADLNSRHVFNPAWPQHARFHCAAYCLTNVLIGAVCLFLLLSSDGGNGGVPRQTVVTVAALLGGASIVFLAAALFPGVDSGTPTEPRFLKLPVSSWVTAGVLLLTLLGTWEAL